MRPKAILVAAIALTSALLVTAQTRPAAIPLQSGDIVIRGGLIFDSVRDDGSDSLRFCLCMWHRQVQLDVKPPGTM